MPEKVPNLQTPVALQFEEARIRPGTYVLRARLDETSEWWLEISAGPTTAGKVALKKTQASAPEAHLKITLAGTPNAATLKILWGTQLLETHFKVAE